MIALYRKGNSHNVRGIVCEVGRFHSSKLKQRLLEGWVIDPKLINAIEVKSVSANQKIRLEAKLLGVEAWETARISTLKELISA